MLPASNYQKKVQTYFIAELGRPATREELDNYSQKLAENNGNVWKAGLVGNTGYLTQKSAFPQNSTVEEFSNILETQFYNLTGKTIPLNIKEYYMGHLENGTIKLKGLSNAIINDTKMMPKADGSIGQPANWVIDLSNDLPVDSLTALNSKLDYSQNLSTSLTLVESQAIQKDATDLKAVLASIVDQNTLIVSMDNISNLKNEMISKAFPAQSGKVIDGYVSGATVFADTDGDGLQDANEISTQTNANGDYTLPSGAVGKIVAFGGTDILTGKPFQGVLTAPEGSSQITPLTTLVQATIESGKSLSDAKDIVSQRLGIDANAIDIMAYDPIKALVSDPTDQTALTIQKTAQQVASIVSQITNVIYTDVNPFTNTFVQLSSEITKELVKVILNTTTGETLDLTSTAVISSVINSSATSLGADSVASQSTKIAEVTASSNVKIKSASTLNDLVKSAIVSQSDAVDVLKMALSNNNVDDFVNDFTNTIDNGIESAPITGSLAEGLSVLDVINGSNDTNTDNEGTTGGGTVTPPSGGGNSGGGGTVLPPAPTLTTLINVSDNTISVGGTTTGDLLITLSGTEASFSRGGVVAVESISSINDKVIDFSGNIVLSVTGTAASDNFIINAPNAASISFAPNSDLGDGHDRIQINVSDAETNMTTINIDTNNLLNTESLLFAMTDAKDVLILSNTSSIKNISKVEYGAFNFDQVAQESLGGLDFSEVPINEFGAPQIIAVGQVFTLDAI